MSEQGIQQYLQIGEGHANSLRTHYWASDHSFAGDIFEAYHNPELMHHGQSHSRRVEKLTGKFIRNLTEEYPDDFRYPEVSRDIFAATICPYYHDLSQTLTARQNLRRRENGVKPLHEKKGHGVGAAHIVLGMAEDYAALNGVSYEEAWEICSVSAVMQMHHDIPENFDKSFNPENEKAFHVTETGVKVLLRGQELLDRFEACQLDLFSLAPSQIAEIHFLQKVHSGFISDERSGHGHIPSAEDYFSRQFSALNADDRPLLDYLSDDRKNMIRSLALCNYYADTGDMIAPPFEQIPRTLEAQYAQGRPFTVFTSDSGVTVEEIFHTISTNGGNGFGGDDMRMLWEAIHGGKLSKVNKVSELPSVQAFFKENILMGVMQFREVGSAILRDDWTVFDEGYARRIRKLQERVAKNIREGLEDISEEEYLSRLHEKVTHIEHEREMVKDLVDSKHRRLGANFDDSSVTRFQGLIDRVIEHITSSYQISDEEFSRLQSMAAKWENPPSISFGVDSVPRKKIRRTNRVGYNGKYYGQR